MDKYIVVNTKIMYRHYLNRTVENRLDAQKFRKSNYFCWTRSTAVMEAYFPRKALGTSRAQRPLCPRELCL